MYRFGQSKEVMVPFEQPTWGVIDPAELRRIVVLSPHFDDAALSAGYLLASYPGSTVITVMAGRPPQYPTEPTEWDTLAGFKAGDDVVALRREEDLRAMDELGATAHWLEFSDWQYLMPDKRATPEEVAQPLEEALVDPHQTAVFAPMGLGNPDHDLTHQAAMLVREKHQELAWFCYEDQGYKHLPGLLAWRLARLLRHGPWPTPAIVPHEEDEERKRRAIWCYASQIPPMNQGDRLTRRLDAKVPEQFWRLAPPPKGWEGLADSI